jgi:Ni/Fe-hydrogenase subunit HybB-like protein
MGGKSTVNNKLRHFKDILWFIAMFGLMAALFRIWFGLGATTNLTDAMPWGLWKVLNMIAGVALATSGFTIGFLYYVLKLKQFKPLVKPAILVAFLGYGCSCLALLFDIGLPHRFWHPLVMWNEHSFLFEVFWCVTLYFTVTAIELSPTILKRLGAEKISHWLHRIAFGVVIVGISLSSLHHSSLGSLFLVTPLRLHDLWYTPFIPWFFIISAIAAGMMFIIFTRIVYAYFYDPEPIFGDRLKQGRGETYSPGEVGSSRQQVTAGPQLQMLQRLAVISASILAVYLVLKVGELIYSGSMQALLAGTWESWLFAVELFITALLPIVLVAIPQTRRSPYGLGVAAFSASTGLALNRVNVGIFGYFHDAVTPYVPSLTEWALSLGVVAAAALAFFAVAENFPIFDDRWRRREESLGFFSYSFDRLSHVWNTVLNNSLQRRTIIVVFAIPLAWIMLYPPYHPDAGETYSISPPIGVDQTRSV